MKMQLPLAYSFEGAPITHHDRLLLMGSCFTANVGQVLAERMFGVLYNPTGILFDPTALSRHLLYLCQNRQITADELVSANELWHSWEHHSDFSHIQQEQAVAGINAATAHGHAFLKEASCLVLTLGSAFRYVLVEDGRPVANNHRAPAAMFRKELLEVGEMVEALTQAIAEARQLNPRLQVLFTVSPVRHSRDGLIQNNRSKGRLLEAVHQLCEQLPAAYYFPAYEWVIDVLRDHRWYDIDLVHPNYAATQWVFEQFCATCMPPETVALAETAYKFTLAAKHRPRFPETQAHQNFVSQQQAALKEFLRLHPELVFQPPASSAPTKPLTNQ
ncbi:MAG: GSCFA domain-containing protein [Sphingobacteriaceae bacterium]|nr:GSCFA domain-containing protein [Sphingobacteriaceae bacterium]